VKRARKTAGGDRRFGELGKVLGTCVGVGKGVRFPSRDDDGQTGNAFIIIGVFVESFSIVLSRERSQSSTSHPCSADVRTVCYNHMEKTNFADVKTISKRIGMEARNP
jgi:hypothetical protein